MPLGPPRDRDARTHTERARRFHAQTYSCASFDGGCISAGNGPAGPGSAAANDESAARAERLSRTSRLLPEIAALPPEAPAPAVATQSDLARNIQLELLRLGCARGDAEGDWNADAKDAVRKFNRYAKAKLDINAPSQEMMVALRDYDRRICPLGVRTGYSRARRHVRRGRARRSAQVAQGRA